MENIVIALIVHTAALLGILLKWYLDISKEKKQKIEERWAIENLSPSIGIINKDRFSSDARELLLDSHIDRVLMLKVTNGGGIINLVTPMYVTCIEEIVTHELKPIKNFLQKWQTDEQYNRMLSEMVSKGVVDLQTSEMPASQLKEIYTQSRVTFAKIFFLAEMRGTKQEIFYVSIGTLSDTGFTIDEKAMISLFVQKYKGQVNSAIAELKLTYKT